MTKTIPLLASVFVSCLAGPSIAADHLFTAVDNGGLTTSSQPFQNGTNNPGRSGETVPGQGSVLSGEDTTVPAVESSSLLTHHFTELNTHANPGNGTLRTPPPAASGTTTTTTTTLSRGSGMNMSSAHGGGKR